MIMLQVHSMVLIQHTQLCMPAACAGHASSEVWGQTSKSAKLYLYKWLLLVEMGTLWHDDTACNCHNPHTALHAGSLRTARLICAFEQGGIS